MLEQARQLLSISFLGNTLDKYIIFAIIILTGLIFKRLLAKAIGYIIFRVFKKSAREVGVKQFYQLTRKPLGSFLLLIFIYIACEQLSFPSSWHLVAADQFGLRLVLFALYETLLLLCIVWIGVRIVDFAGLIFMARAAKDDNKMNDQLIPFAVDILKIVVWTLGIFLILGTVFHLNVGSLIAGLGIGGLAIALAAKDTLENLFGSFTIFLDKPFIIGDLVKVGEITGTVEKIGFRSTRLRTFEKSYVTIPNKKMVDAELDNLTMRTSMRVQFPIGLRYDTAPSTIKNIISGVTQHLKSHPKVDEDFVVRLSSLGESSLQIFTLYYVETADWNEYMNIREDINFLIMETVHSQGAEFARPGSSIWIEKK